MEVGLKERVIGAVVLVVLGIIIIPWVLQGPAPDHAVTHELALPAAATTAAPQEYRMPLTSSGTSPVVSETSPGAVQNSPQPVQSVPSRKVVAARPTTPTIVRGSAAVTPTHAAGVSAGHPTTGQWMIQAGSYASERNAQALKRKLEQHGYHVTLSPHVSAGRTYFRVRVGPYAARRTAEQALPGINRLYRGKAKVVPND